MSDEPPIIGIDLGTTYSLVSVLQGGQPILLPNALGETLTPSAVSIDTDGTLLLGAPARARAATHPGDTVMSFKRDMGTARKYRLGKRAYTPVELSAMVIGALKADAERALGVEIREAVITVPAYFGDAQRQATRDAGKIAGLVVERIINEPTAAAMAYGLHHPDKELQAVVLDLGGGTFDVTVLECIEGVIEIQSSAGDAHLGGDDFRDVLLAHLKERAQSMIGVPLGTEGSKTWARLREAAEQAKRRLSTEANVTVALPGLADDRGTLHDVSIDLDGDAVAELFVPVIEKMRGPIRRALRDARISPGDVGEVLLVGGATRMPLVAELSAELFGQMPLAVLHADEAVAQGAAIQAGLKADDASVEDLVVTDVAPFTIGIATGSKMGRSVVDGLFSPIIDRGTVIPTSRVMRFFTLEAHQRELKVQIFQGEHSLCKDNAPLGEYVVKRLPRKPAGEVGVDVRLTYDLNGILEVEMEVVGENRVEHLVIERGDGALSKKDIQAAREQMKRIKFHPRDSLPNRTTLARADALFVELNGAARAELSEMIAVFRSVLETQDPAEIDPVREALNAVLANYR